MSRIVFRSLVQLARPKHLSVVLGSVGWVLMLVLTARLGSAHPSQAATRPVPLQTEVPFLELEKPIEREIKAGETHSYRVTAPAGRYLEVQARQISVDVALALLEPEGKPVRVVDEIERLGNVGETLFTIIETDGTYQFDVKTSSPETKPGRYEIRLLSFRAATVQDQNRVQAEKLSEAGQRLYKQKRKEDLQQAIPLFEKAIPLFQASGDLFSEAYVWNRLGIVHDDLGNKQQALECFGKALPLTRGNPDRQLEGEVLNNLGLTNSDIGEKQKAIAYFEQALPLFVALGNKSGEASIYNNLGLANRGLGETRRALSFYEQAQALYHSVGNLRQEATAISNLGVVYSGLGEKQKALDAYQKALQMMRTYDDQRGVARMLSNLGSAYSDLGDSESTITYYTQSMELRRKLGDRRGEAYAVNGLALEYFKHGDLPKSAELLNQALALWVAVEDRPGQGLTLTNLGKIAFEQKDFAKAKTYFTNALTLRKTIKDRYGEAGVLRQLGLLHLQLKDIVAGAAALNQALTIFQETGNREDEAETLCNLAGVDFDQGQYRAAISKIERAIELVEFVRAGVASQELRTSYFEKVSSYYDLYVAALMRLHKSEPEGGFDRQALQVSEKRRARSLLELLNESQTGIRRGVTPELQKQDRDLRERINGKTIRLAQLKTAKASPASIAEAEKELTEIIRAYRELQTEIRLKSPRFATLTQPQPLTVKDIQEQLVDADTVLLEYALGAEASFVWLISRQEIVSYELPRQTEIERLAITLNKQLSTPRPLVAETKSATDRNLKPVIPSPSDAWLETATTLSRMILEPMADRLGNKRLLIVPDGALHYVPFGALPQPQGSGFRVQGSGSGVQGSVLSPQSPVPSPLLVQHEIVILPSASALAALRKEIPGRTPAPLKLAVLADPVFSAADIRVKSATVAKPETPQAENSAIAQRSLLENELSRSFKGDEPGPERLLFPRLLGTRKEANEILALVSPKESKVALDFAASRALAFDPDLKRYRMLHIATHGLVNTERPELSGLILSLVNEKGAPQNGFLLTSDLYNLDLSADLVVLSACQTGKGKSVRGEGIVGLTRGFMYAGVPRVVVSLWNVNDRATADLMILFYKGILQENLSPAAALRKAQLAMWKQDRWKAPYFWAAFQLQGEYR
ncbi:MAG: CHAT domain-containing protein [Blastocatellia bacterium]|nr:CHAT domain-containing protein [Blastocatellia bacterium]